MVQAKYSIAIKLCMPNNKSNVQQILHLHNIQSLLINNSPSGVLATKSICCLGWCVIALPPSVTYKQYNVINVKQV